MNSLNTLSVVIPAYNEAKRLPPTLLALDRFARSNQSWRDFEIILVCDGCTDETKMVAHYLENKISNLRIISYIPNRGKGYALRCGVAASNGDLVLTMDADGTTPLTETVWMSELMRQRDAQMVIGSRRARSTRIIEPQPYCRRFLGQLFSQASRPILGLPFSDTQCGFKLYRGAVARKLFSQCRCDHYAIDLEILYRARLCHVNIVEAGIVWHNGPASHVHPFADGLRMLKDMLAIRFMVRPARPQTHPVGDPSPGTAIMGGDP